MLALFCQLTAGAQLQSLTEKVSIHQQQTTALKIVEHLDRQSSYHFTFAQEQLSMIPVQAFKAENISLGEALTQLQKQYGLQFAIDERNISVKASAVKQEPGKVVGKIIDEENGQPVIGATVRIGNTGATTDINGAFSFSIPPGRYTAIVSSIGYGTKEVSGVDVKDNQVFSLHVTLKRKKGQLSTVVVKASAKKESVAALYARQKNAASVTDGISAEQISRTPDINIGQVLNRVSGVTTVTNKYVVVRGLSERYNQAMIDGIVLPSTNMNKRNFSFDVIPQELVSNVVVNKTATADMSSEFSGGQISVNTMDIPEQNFTTISIGTGYNSQTTGKDFLVMGGRGKYDYLGFDDGKRKNPGVISWDWPNQVEIPPPGLPGNDYTLMPGGTVPYSSLDAVAQSKKLSAEAFKVPVYTAAADQQYRLAIGRTYNLKNERRAGFAGGITYRNQQRIVDFNNVRGGGWDANWMDSVENGGGRSYRFNTTLGAALNLGLEGKGFRIGLKNMYSRIYDDNYSEAYRLDYGGDNPDQKSREMIQEPQATWVLQHKLEGDVQLAPNGMKLEVTGAMTRIGQQVQDQRRLKYLQTAEIGGKEYFQTPNVFQKGMMGDDYDYRMWTNVKEIDYNWNIALSQPFTFLQNKSVIKAGYSGWHKHRTLDVTRMIPYKLSTTPAFELPYEVILDTANIGAGVGQAYYWAEKLNGPTFDGAMSTHAAYIMADQRFFDKLRLIYGVRAEHYNLSNRQEEYIRRRFGDIPDAFKLLSTTGEKNWRILPSANLIYSITSAMNLRAAYSRTAIRPDFRETSYFGFYDYEMDANISGRQLVSSIVDNFDLRYEWYPAPGEIISISGFYKLLDKPIELIQLREGHYSFQNQYKAKNYGVEMEIRKSLGFIADRSWLHDLFIFGNGTLLKSHVEVMQEPLPGETFVETRRLPSQDRPLYGQAPWIVNAGILYQGDVIGFTASYNRSGHRSFTVAQNPAEVEYEKGRNMLDMQVSARILKRKAEIRLNLANLLDEYILFYKNIRAYEQTEADATGNYGYRLVNGTTALEKDKGDVVSYRSRTGRNVSISFTYRF